MVQLDWASQMAHLPGWLAAGCPAGLQPEHLHGIDQLGQLWVCQSQFVACVLPKVLSDKYPSV